MWILENMLIKKYIHTYINTNTCVYIEIYINSSNSEMIHQYQLISKYFVPLGKLKMTSSLKLTPLANGGDLVK